MIRQNYGLGNVYIAPLFEFIVRLITSATKVIFGTEIKFSQNLMNCYIGNIIHLQDRWKLKFILKRAL